MPEGWDAQRRADALMAIRDRLLTRLPRMVRQASRLSEDLRELVVDESIQFAALEYALPVYSAEELERVFWDAALKRVRRAGEGRYDTVRGGYGRADLAVLDTLASGATPEDEVLRRAELRVAIEFASRLAPTERRVWACQHTAVATRPLGHTSIARRLGLPVGAVRAAVRSIEDKRQRFAAIYAAGRLCGYVAPAIAELAAGDSAAHSETAARAHLEIDKCPTCRADYTRQLRYLRSARFHGKVGSLLPAPELSDRVRLGGLRDVIVDWAGRLTGHDSAGTVGQLAASGTGRGVGTAAAVKLATLCFAGAGVVGACVATGVLPDHQRPDHPSRPAAATRSAEHTPTAREPRPPLATATSTPTPRRRARAQRASLAAQGSTGPRSHEQTPASPAPSNAAANGASEFDPTYQPSTSPQPAPVPAAPGGSEFF
jgi:hypothetical protein